MATGNGAFVVHKMIERYIPEYRVEAYHPYWTLLPMLLPLAAAIGKPRLIHTTPDHAPFFARRGVPLVVSFQNYVLDPFMAAYSTIPQRVHYATDLRLFTRLSLRLASRVTAVSQATAALVRQDLGFRGPIDIIYNGVDTHEFSPPTRMRSRPTVRVLFSGNLTRRKGAELLPLLRARLPQTIQLYYASGLRKSCPFQDMAGLTCLGSIPHHRMPAIYREMDILFMPTVREGLSLAILEAMACGLPVVATDGSSIPEQIVEGRGGYLCSRLDIDAFVDRILTLADSPASRKEMGEFNRAKAEEQFNKGKMITQYRELFEGIMNKPRAYETDRG
jgi:glycosyltransferase involved in cell wall biosynthesis